MKYLHKSPMSFPAQGMGSTMLLECPKCPSHRFTKPIVNNGEDAKWVCARCGSEAIVRKKTEK